MLTIISPIKNYRITTPLLFLLFITSFNGISQSFAIDSLKAVASNYSNGDKSKIYLQIAKEYKNSNYDSVVAYGNKAIDCAFFLKDKNVIIESLIELAYINVSIGNMEKSLLQYNKAKQMCLEEDNQYLLAKIYINLERYYTTVSDYASGLSSLDTAIQIIDRNSFTQLKSTIYRRYSNLYILIQDYSIATHFAKLAISFSKNETNKSNQIKNLILHGIIFFHTSDIDSSMFYLKNALALAKTTNNKMQIQRVYRKISDYYIRTMDYDKSTIYIDSSIIYCNELVLPSELAALITFKAHILSLKGDYVNTLKYNLQALELRKRIGHNRSICASLINIGGNYTQLKEYDKAHFYLNQGIKIAQDQYLLNYLAYGFAKLSIINKLQGNYEKALQNYELSTSYKDSLLTNKTNEKVMFFRSQFELEKGKTLSEQIKLKKRTNETIFLIITTILSVGIIILLSRLNYLKVRSNKELTKARERAEESDSLKSAFLANMSHEIRTPMNGILGFADLLKRPNLTGEQQQKYIDIIEESGVRMLNIINDIISISKIESGQMEINITESNINEQTEYIYNFFKPEIEEKGIAFSLVNKLSPGECIIKTDSEKVYAILTNLVKNAVKYTPEGFIEFGCKKSGNFIEFYVKDSGIGVPKDRQKAIFERFIQADIADTRAYQGAGLGLSISKAYVELLGGEIWMESNSNKDLEENRSDNNNEGSEFHFTLPYKTEVSQEDNIIKNEVLPPSDSSPIRNVKILIVEDDETSEKLISIAVRKFGNKSISVTTGTEAVEACRSNPDIDLILMDIQLPGLNGYEATKEIRKFNNDVIIIAQTAFALSGDREKAIAAGCNDYISKPIIADELNNKIIKHLNI
jgi:signal transduction histidine kinase/CheY-like chemotaxis protein